MLPVFTLKLMPSLGHVKELQYFRFSVICNFNPSPLQKLNVLEKQNRGIYNNNDNSNNNQLFLQRLNYFLP